MNHSSLRSLHLLLEHAERARDDALARLRRAEATLRQAETQAMNLQNYRAECDQRWTGQFRQGAAITLVQCYQQFSGRLEGAVGMQNQQTERLRQDLERRQAELQDCEMRVASVRKLVERRGQQLQLHASRQEQKQIDERASRMAWQQSQAGTVSLEG